jgi:hypothetical protein
MNHGFLAPQFGLGRASTHRAEEGANPTAKAPAPTGGGNGPTVTFKRRRLLEGPDIRPNEAPVAPVKAPKVFTLQAPAAPARPLEPAAVDAPVQAAPLSAPKVRRRRDPSRAPTLVQHLVFQHEAPAAAVAEADPPEDRSLHAKLRPAAVEPDAELRTSTRCREAALALDAHFKRLGF